MSVCRVTASAARARNLDRVTRVEKPQRFVQADDVVGQRGRLRGRARGGQGAPPALEVAHLAGTSRIASPPAISSSTTTCSTDSCWRLRCRAGGDGCCCRRRTSRGGLDELLAKKTRAHWWLLRPKGAPSTRRQLLPLSPPRGATGAACIWHWCPCRRPGMWSWPIRPLLCFALSQHPLHRPRRCGEYRGGHRWLCALRRSH